MIKTCLPARSSVLERPVGGVFEGPRDRGHAKRSAQGTPFQNHSVSVAALLLVLLMLCQSGCVSHKEALRQTEPFYLSRTAQTLAPKPENYEVPFLESIPKTAKVIGSFQLATERGRRFALESIRHNARRAGADAVWIRGMQDHTLPLQKSVPAHWETRQAPDFVTLRRVVPGVSGAPAHVETSVVPRVRTRHDYVPAQEWTEQLHYTTVDVLMLRLP